jgi:TfoX/Sxy family transcriptional regulator of competence genes
VPYDRQTAERVRAALQSYSGIVERKMFGGLAFLLHGHMCCGVVKEDLVLRLGEDGAKAALAEPYTRAMDFTGKPIKSMVYVDPGGFESDRSLKAWISRAVEFISALPPKT